jgi:undecaprenyl-diphosphatase
MKTLRTQVAGHGRKAVSALREFAVKELGVIVALFVFAGGALAFLEIAEEVAEGDTASLDRAILYAFREPENPAEPIGPDWLDMAAMDITAFGSAIGLGLIVFLVAGLFLSLRRWREAFMLVAAPLTGVAISQGLKLLFARERPDSIVRAVEVVNASFPSGHAMLSAVTYLTLAALVERFTASRRVQLYAMAAGVFITLLVGMSRVYLGVHWPSDVLAGWCIGAAWAIAWWLAAWSVERTMGPGVVTTGPKKLGAPGKGGGAAIKAPSA